MGTEMISGTQSPEERGEKKKNHDGKDQKEQKLEFSPTAGGKVNRQKAPNKILFYECSHRYIITEGTWIKELT